MEPITGKRVCLTAGADKRGPLPEWYTWGY